jgi:hypothetical protein
MVSQSIAPDVNGGWLKMRPYDDGTPADSINLFQGNNGVNIGKDLSIIPNIDVEIKIIPTALFYQDPYNMSWTDFNSIFIDADDEFKIGNIGIDIWDIYIRAREGAGDGEARIYIGGTWDENRINRGRT